MQAGHLIFLLTCEICIRLNSFFFYSKRESLLPVKPAQWNWPQVIHLLDQDETAKLFQEFYFSYSRIHLLIYWFVSADRSRSYGLCGNTLSETGVHSRLPYARFSTTTFQLLHQRGQTNHGEVSNFHHQFLPVVLPSSQQSLSYCLIIHVKPCMEMSTYILIPLQGIFLYCSIMAVEQILAASFHKLKLFDTSLMRFCFFASYSLQTLWQPSFPQQPHSVQEETAWLCPNAEEQKGSHAMMNSLVNAWNSEMSVE